METAPKFFVPDVKPGSEEEFYQNIRKHVSEVFACTDRRIYRIKFRQNGQDEDVWVGQNFERMNYEKVFAILQGGPGYLICTARRGVLEGDPAMVGDGGVSFVQDFEPD